MIFSCKLDYIACGVGFVSFCCGFGFFFPSVYKKNHIFSEGMLDIYSGKQKRDVDAVNFVAVTIEVCKAECQLLSNGIRTFISNHLNMSIDCLVTRENLL